MLFEALLIGGAVLLGKAAIDHPEATGKMLGQMAEQGKQIQEFKNSYESWDNYSLKVEYNTWNSKSTTEAKYRKAAINSILRDRGVIE